MSLLRIENLSVSFGGLKALSGVDITVEPGEVVGLIGPNGAGKTTVFNAISGFISPDEGSFRWRNVESPWPKPHQLHKVGIARTLQGVGLFPDLTCLENVMVALDHQAKTGVIRGLLGATDRDERALKKLAMEALDRVGAAALAPVRASQLPYPTRKRVALARALASEPTLLLLDEPAGGLGADDIEWLQDLISSLRSTCSILLVEHHMEVVMAVSDRIYVLDFGQIIASGIAEQVKSDPAVIAAYLGSAAVGRERFA
ncbi:lipopolysaccharide export system ATP-binding protein LptB [mine drainage metagenome]|uniref:Lipopolysaccharide export system ATP-binding protein LptB n=1 Tax=mine drainage metagenome TaxID=410659 RepID=A0A1J5Q9D9_9ZZZZ